MKIKKEKMKLRSGKSGKKNHPSFSLLTSTQPLSKSSLETKTNLKMF